MLRADTPTSGLGVSGNTPAFQAEVASSNLAARSMYELEYVFVTAFLVVLLVNYVQPWRSR